jgi:hypothetical protein
LFSLVKVKEEISPVSATSLVETERLLKECKLGKDEEPETWITSLENLSLKLEVTGSFMTDDQFMVQFLKTIKASDDVF